MQKHRLETPQHRHLRLLNNARARRYYHRHKDDNHVKRKREERCHREPQKEPTAEPKTEPTLWLL